MGVGPRSIEADGVSVSIWGSTILRNLSFRLHAGELCAVIGPSGSGKSTLIKVLLGLQRPSEGRVTIGGLAPADTGPMGYVPQHDALHRSLTVRSELRYAALLRRPALDDAAVDELVEQIAAQVELSHRLDLRIRKLSGGQRKRVSVAMELLTDPALLVLDEPTSGLDPGLEGRLMGLFAEVAARGRMVLTTTHAMQSLDRCDALLVIVEGHLAYFGPPADALDFFHTEEHEGIFDQLHKLTPPVWQRTYSHSDVARWFPVRRPPSLPQKPGPAGEEPPVDRALAELERLKRERGAE